MVAGRSPGALTSPHVSRHRPQQLPPVIDPVQTYHLRDVGKLLSQIHSDLARFRSDPSQHKDPTALLQAIEKAQADLQQKTTVVFESSLGHDGSQCERPASVTKFTRPRSLSRQQADQLIKEIIDSHSQPERNQHGHRQSAGKLHRGLPANLSTPMRRRPNGQTAPVPIRIEDAKRGLLHLISSGLIPRQADVTDALVGERGGLRLQPVVLHNNAQKFVHGFVATCAPMPANVVLDLTTPVRGAVADVLKVKRERYIEPQLFQVPVPDPVPDPEPVSLRSFVEEPTPARDFNELLDTYSLHEFLISHGSALTQTPEFSSFRRRYETIWGAIQTLIRRLEDIMTVNRVALAHINGQQLALLAELPDRPPTAQELLQCVTNRDQVKIRPGRSRCGNQREDAAVQIQATWRMARQRRRFKKERLEHRSARAIAIAYRLWSQRRQTRHHIGERWQKDLAKWRARQDAFRRRWSRIRERRRVVVHLVSVWRSPDQRAQQKTSANPLDDLDRVHSLQLTRLLDLMDPNVEIIYVSLTPVSDEIQRYYLQLLQIRGAPSLSTRLRFLTPESAKLLQPSSPLSTILYFSSKCLNRIRTLTKGQSAYIVPHIVGEYDLKLAVFLDLPMLGPEPQICRSLSSSSGCKRVFAEAVVNYPVGAHDIYSEDDLCDNLSHLIIKNLDVQRWMIKLNDECGGRGLAYFEPARLRIYSDLVHESKTSTKFTADDVIAFNWRRLKTSLKQRLQFIAKLVHANVYGGGGWRQYISRLGNVGGCIEACPSFVTGSPNVNLFIDPVGHCSLISTHDQVFGRPYVLSGVVCPQSTFDNDELCRSALAIGQVCANRGVIGYVGIEFVVSYNESTKLSTLLAVDLNLRMTTSHVTFSFFNFLCAGQFSIESGEYDIGTERAPLPIERRLTRSLSQVSSTAELNHELQEKLSPKRCYAAFFDVVVPALTSIHHNALFNMCRIEGVSFDMSSRSGTSFVFADSIASAALCIVGIGETHCTAIECLNKAISFLKNRIGVRDRDLEASNLQEYCSVIRMMIATGNASNESFQPSGQHEQSDV